MIKIIEYLVRYFVDSNEFFEYKFCYQFLVECILCYYIEYVGKKMILMKGFDELWMVVKYFQFEIDFNELDVIK